MGNREDDIKNIINTDTFLQKCKQYNDNDEEATTNLLQEQINQRIDLLNQEEDNEDDYREMEEVKLDFI